MLKIKLSLLALLFSSTLFAKASLSDAVTAYDKGDYKQASEIYETLIREGARNGSVYYNLGNSYFRLGEKGKAIAAYLAARRLMPRDPDIKANLKFVHDQMADKLSMRSSSIYRELSFWVDMFTPRELLYFSSFLAAIALTFLFLSLVVGKFAFLRMWSVLFSVLAFLAFFVFAISLFYDETWGAVTVPLAEVRSGPGQQNTVVFQLHEGAPFVLDEMEGEWFRVHLSDNKIGWLPAKDALFY